MSDYSSVAPPQSQQNFSQSSAFAAALQRAKQIAAKIQPTGQGSKRPLEDPIDSESKKFGGSEYSSPQSSSGMSPAAMQAAVQAAAVAARLAQCNTTNTIVNEDIRVPDKMVGLIIGRGGEQITRLQSETGCKIQMAADSGGTPDRICSLSGSREAVNRARDLVSKIVSQHGNATIDIISSTTVPNPTAAANNQGGGFSSGNSNNSVGSNGGGSNTSANGERREGGNGGGAGNGGNSSGYGGSQYEEIMIPGPKVGLVIGKGGETIKQLQEKTGAKMVVIQDGPSQELEKPLRISGDPQKVEHAKQLVYELIQEKDPFYNRGYNEGDQAEVFVPKAAVGVVIGKGGDMIKKIQGETGCKLQFIQGRGDGPGDRRCIIQGTQQQVDDAKRIIEDLIESVMRREGGNGGGGAGGAGNMNRNNGNNFCGEMGYPNQQMREDVSFVVPASKCGIIIGRGGETIKQINQQSGAYCEMDRKTQNSLTEKAFTIKGTSEQIEHARRIISDKIGLQIKIIGGSGGNGSMGDGNNGQYNMQGGNNGGNTPNSYPQWGYTPQTWEQTQQQQQQQQQNVQVNPSTGQPDYSAQWIDYYRSMGLHREAEMIEQQLKAKQTGQPSGGQSIVPNSNQSNGVVQSGQMPGQPQSGPMQGNMNAGQQQQQPDYSAQWAEYYRSIGKNEEADAIDNQIKATKQPGPMGPQGGPVPSMPGYSMPGGPGGPQGMMPGGYAQYPQFYTGAGGAGGQPGGQGGAAGQPGAYGQNFGAYGGYPGPGGAGGGGAGGAPGPGSNQASSQSQNASNDKN